MSSCALFGDFPESVAPAAQPGRHVQRACTWHDFDTSLRYAVRSDTLGQQAKFRDRPGNRIGGA